MQFNNVVFQNPLTPMITANSPLSIYLEIPSAIFCDIFIIPPKYYLTCAEFKMYSIKTNTFYLSHSFDVDYS